MVLVFGAIDAGSEIVVIGLWTAVGFSGTDAYLIIRAEARWAAALGSSLLSSWLWIPFHLTIVYLAWVAPLIRPSLATAISVRLAGRVFIVSALRPRGPTQPQ